MSDLPPKPPQPKRKRFLTVPEVADELGISERSAWRRIEQGELRSHGFGGSTRVARDDLHAYIARTRRRREERPEDDDDGPGDGT